MAADDTGSTPPTPKAVIFQADDFGLNEPVTRGIIQGFEQGPLTSTAAMANSPFFHQAMTFWKNLEQRRATGDLPSSDTRRMLGEHEVLPFDFGVHLNLTQGKPLTGESYPAQLLTSEGFFPGIGSLFFKLFGRARKYRTPIFDELSAQISLVRDHGIQITHLNGHQYLETLPAISTLIPELTQKFSIPIVRSSVETNLWETTAKRGEFESWALSQIKRRYAKRHAKRLKRHGIAYPDGYFGTSHAGRVDEVLETFLENAPADGVTEICLHPATAPGHHTLIPIPGWEDPLEKLRPKELKELTSATCFNLLRKYRVRLSRFSALAAPK